MTIYIVQSSSTLYNVFHLLVDKTIQESILTIDITF